MFETDDLMAEEDGDDIDLHEGTTLSFEATDEEEEAVKVEEERRGQKGKECKKRRTDIVTKSKKRWSPREKFGFF